ncbi:MAG: hypothetical protein WBA31_03915 [Candidatus Dormiibacterota bacterium]
MSVEAEAPSKRMELARLVGEDAAATTYRAFRWQVTGVAVWVFALAVLVAVAELGAPAPGYLALLLALVFVGVEVRAIHLYFQGGRVASGYLSQAAGVPIRVRGFSLQPRSWQKQIAKSTAQHTELGPTG